MTELRYDFQFDGWQYRRTGTKTWHSMCFESGQVKDDVLALRSLLCHKFERLFAWAERSGMITEMAFYAYLDVDRYVVPIGHIDLKFWPDQNVATVFRTIWIQTEVYLPTADVPLSYRVDVRGAKYRNPSKRSWRMIKKEIIHETEYETE